MSPRTHVHRASGRAFGLLLCVAVAAPIAACGPLSPEQIPCNSGPVTASGECAPTLCGAGTREQDGVCVPVDDRCGPGTVAEGSRCVPAPKSTALFEVRTLSAQFPADGRTKLPILSIGREPDGSPSLREVILSPSRGDAGAVLPARQRLTEVGATSYFVPCNAALTPGCLGSFTVRLALTDRPTEPVAESWKIELVEQKGVGSPLACQTGGNVLFFDGDSSDYVHPGLDTVTRGQWSATASTGALPDTVRVRLTPALSSQGLWWDLEFNSRQLNQPLEPKVYEDAQRAPFAASGHPGISVTGDGRGCNTIAGRFQIHELTVASGQVTRFTASFEQRCEAGSRMLRGCVHFEQ